MTKPSPKADRQVAGPRRDRAADALQALLKHLAASKNPLVAEWAGEMTRAAAARRRREKAARARKRADG
jgi:hypothetical protein